MVRADIDGLRKKLFGRVGQNPAPGSRETGRLTNQRTVYVPGRVAHRGCLARDLFEKIFWRIHRLFFTHGSDIRHLGLFDWPRCANPGTDPALRRAPPLFYLFASHAIRDVVFFPARKIPWPTPYFFRAAGQFGDHLGLAISRRDSYLIGS